jgi:ubiquinone/menaquinone biosynthesis C-methylase UbiE
VIAVPPRRDQWAEWLLERRHGGDAALLEQQLPELYEFRDRVLANAAIAGGDVVLDVGAGNGLIGFGALDKVGPRGQVIFSDISEDLLNECRRLAEELGQLERCRFLRAPADDLLLDDASVDVVTTRSVLIYLMDKRPAFDEFFRVLRPGGRLSIFEPINIFGHEERRRLYYGVDVSPVERLAEKIRAQRKRPDEHPLLNFDERDLLRLVDEAGFEDIRLEYTARIRSKPHWATSWDVLKRLSGNPLDPTPEEEIAAVLTPDEQREFEDHMRSRLEARPLVPERTAGAYLCAMKRAA